ncbi:TPA: hypothetical protein ACJCXE_002960 [Yersinia enterocolitica]|nr:hypothetical protein [Yersinia enterocolitica]EKN4848192.1 hypothetical protein [Yersinia enterocolitica]EKN5117337.1 hypothetical protein [Yersinia enterocolitica]HDL6782462.1 hypothetical protein [Yersinia enterocolitica]HDL8247551.1 hypothetical protein [Yersinia enterocolitica]
MLSEEQKSQIKMSMNDKWHLVKLTHVWPDGHLINQMAHALIERNAELLSLREQLAEKEERLCRLRTSLEIEMKGHEAAERQLAVLKAGDVNNKVDITCYSCRRFITFQQYAEADGFCPYCGVEIELDGITAEPVQFDPPATE